jgi:predicted NBD/HSP70 family sugar kinase
MSPRKEEISYALGLDIGGTSVKAAVVSSAGDLGEKFQAPSPNNLEELRDFFRAATQKATVPLSGVGCLQRHYRCGVFTNQSSAR